jgi:multidrug efflux system membrane fusion protein
VGNYVSAGDTNGIAVVTVMDPIDVQFSLPQDQIPAVQKRLTDYQATLPATALDRNRTTTLAEGAFSTLDNRVDTTTGTVKAKARFPNKNGTLFPNQFVNIRLQLDTLKHTVTVPAGAVRQGSTGGSFVYLLDRASSTVTMHPVKTGQTYADKIAILEGLKPGDEVITEGGDRLKDGAAVQLPSDQPAAGGAAAPKRNWNGANGGANGAQRGQRRQQAGMSAG